VLPMIDKQGTAKRIRYFMKVNRLRPTDLQTYLGLTCVQTVYRWLEGINIPSVDNLYALSYLFGIKMDDMIVGSRRLNCSMYSYELRNWLLVYYDQFYALSA